MTRVLIVSLLAALAFTVSAQSASHVAFCTGAQLSGSFAVVLGSAGAGNISYRLRLKNHSLRSCSVTGLPAVQLLGRTGKALPTHVHAAFPGALTAVLVTLASGQRAKATARFSPDVPGVGEGRGQCEPTAYRLRVTARGGGTTTVPVSPVTPVCEHGALQFSAFSHA